MSPLRDYALVTAAYWAFTLTDGALRMLVLLHFHALGYSPLELAFLFLFYELFGVVTNLVGGYAAARFGMKATLTSGLALQAVALVLLSVVSPAWAAALSVPYVMGVQSLSGIAKDLTKMSAKGSLKALLPEDAHGRLFRWVAVLTGSKNALKGAGFFLGGLLLPLLGFRGALLSMAGAVALVAVGTQLSLPGQLGRAKAKPKFQGLLSKNRAVNVLSAARFFLFGARDVWFVVGVPVFLYDWLGFGFTEVGGFLAAWVIGYGAVQAAAPALIARWTKGNAPQGRSAQVLAFLLAGITAALALGFGATASQAPVVLGGLALFGLVFAVNSSVHSFLILAYSEGDAVAMNVGFYYMANAAGRLVGTLFSGLLFQYAGVGGCLWGSAAFACAAGVCSLGLPQLNEPVRLDALEVEGGGD